jgi:maltose alpha-D-glucosyltransferase/alpha-amylase
MEVLLDNYVIEQAIYNLGRELVDQTNHVNIPLRRILHLLEIDPDEGSPSFEAEKNV